MAKMADDAPERMAKARANAAKAKALAKMKKNPANYTMKGTYGFDGMQGQTGPEAKLKGK